MSSLSIKLKQDSDLLDYLRANGCNGDWDAIASSLNENVQTVEGNRSGDNIRNYLASLHKLNMANKRYWQIHEGYEPILKTITKDMSIMDQTFVLPRYIILISTYFELKLPC